MRHNRLHLTKGLLRWHDTQHGLLHDTLRGHSADLLLSLLEWHLMLAVDQIEVLVGLRIFHLLLLQ